jgi:hypothetical protein
LRKYSRFRERIAVEYFGGNFVATISGKAAITRALQHYNLQKEDNVLIVTTTGNKYISGA